MSTPVGWTALRPCVAGVSLFGGHVIEVWTWQIYLYAVATTLGVTLNAVGSWAWTHDAFSSILTVVLAEVFNIHPDRKQCSCSQNPHANLVVQVLFFSFLFYVRLNVIKHHRMLAYGAATPRHCSCTY